MHIGLFSDIDELDEKIVPELHITCDKVEEYYYKKKNRNKIKNKICKAIHNIRRFEEKYMR